MSAKPTIRLKFKEPLPSPPAVNRPPKASSPTIGTEEIRARCGHVVVLDLYVKDPFRDGRRQKATSRDCPSCRRVRAETEAVAAAERRAARKVTQRTFKPRLPDGARFSATYDAAAIAWTGALVVDGTSFEQRASSLRKLLHRLDDAYRASLLTGAVGERGAP